MKLQTISAVTLLLLATESFGQEKICVYDPAGTQGDNYSFMKDYALAAKKWGADVTLKAYTDDQRLNDDFKSDKCDGMSTFGARAREFNQFTGSIDSIGGIPSSAIAKKVILLMANPKLAANMVNRDSEVVGVFPVGAAYPIVRDRKINKIADLYDKRVGVLPFDKAQPFILERVGATVVPVTMSTIAKKFNTGQLDVINMPALVFQPFELKKGIGAEGAVINLQALYATIQIIIRPSQFPAGYGQSSRNWVASQLDHQLKVIKETEADIPPRFWLNIPASDTLSYYKIFRDVRIKLTNDGFYSSKMMTILRKARCQQDMKSYECVGNEIAE